MSGLKEKMTDSESLFSGKAENEKNGIGILFIKNNMLLFGMFVVYFVSGIFATLIVDTMSGNLSRQKSLIPFSRG
ncbi:MAG: hypothetical protein HY885_15695 [Deltaproteobacteria bacterium]|nr:hypothetical protein [Deltaproteobacteria bacterium]